MEDNIKLNESEISKVTGGTNRSIEYGREAGKNVREVKNWLFDFWKGFRESVNTTDNIKDEKESQKIEKN